MVNKEATEDWISMNEFARRIGCSKGAVQKGFMNGRIERRESDKKFHWPTQSVAWNKNRNVSAVRNGVYRDAPVPGESARPVEEPSSTTSMSKAKLVTAIATAEIKKLQAGKMANTLVEKSLVERAQFVFCRTIRDAIMNIPDRVSSEVGANITEYILSVVRASLGEENAKKVVANMEQSEIVRIINMAWTKESRYILEHIKDYESNEVTGR